MQGFLLCRSIFWIPCLRWLDSQTLGNGVKIVIYRSVCAARMRGGLTHSWLLVLFQRDPSPVTVTMVTGQDFVSLKLGWVLWEPRRTRPSKCPSAIWSFAAELQLDNSFFFPWSFPTFSVMFSLWKFLESQHFEVIFFLFYVTPSLLVLLKNLTFVCFLLLI